MKMAGLALLLVGLIAVALFGVGKFMWSGDARWLLLCAGLLLIPRQ